MTVDYKQKQKQQHALPDLADPLREAAAEHLEIAKTAQDEVLADSETVINRWIARRRESAEAMAELGRDALHAKTAQDVVQLWMEWSKGALDRMIADSHDHLAVGTTVASQVAKSSTALAMTWSAPETKDRMVRPFEKANGSGARSHGHG